MVLLKSDSSEDRFDPVGLLGSNISTKKQGQRLKVQQDRLGSFQPPTEVDPLGTLESIGTTRDQSLKSDLWLPLPLPPSASASGR